MKLWNNNKLVKPKDGTPVLVYMPSLDEEEQMQVKMWHEDIGSWSDPNLDYWENDERITHWMKLPDKPKT